MFNITSNLTTLLNVIFSSVNIVMHKCTCSIKTISSLLIDKIEYISHVLVISHNMKMVIDLFIQNLVQNFDV